MGLDNNKATSTNSSPSSADSRASSSDNTSYILQSPKWKSNSPASQFRAQHWSSKVHTEGVHFKDEHERFLSLRGVNVCANSKLPTSPNGSTHLREGFFNHRDVSFLDRPFPLSEADEHFGRLRSWGLTFLRLLVPWETLGNA